MAQKNLRLLLVDDEEDLVWSLKSRLSKALPQVTVDATSKPEEASRWLQTTAYDLVISDIRMPQMSGLELLIAARQRQPNLPFIIITAFPSEEGHREVLEFGSVIYIEKPFELEVLLTGIERQLSQAKAGFSGAMQLETLPDLVQLFTLSNMSGALHIWRSEQHGTLWFDRGAVVHAEAGPLRGVDAFNEVLSWSGGRFELRRHVRLPERTIFEGTTALLLEVFRRMDESKRDTESELSAPEPLTLETDGLPGSPEELAVYTDALSHLRGLAGYLGSCAIHVSTRQLIAADRQTSAIDVEAAGLANIDVISAKQQVIERLGFDDTIDDMIITISSQYHLMRPLRGRRDIFFYLVVDRPLANLATARLVLRSAERSITA